MKKTFQTLISSVAAILLLSACAQHIFYPNASAWKETPSDYQYHFTDTYLSAHDDANIHIWQIKTPQKNAKGAILYFHGNSKNVSYHLEQVTWLLDAGYDVSMAEYRGYGAAPAELSLQQTREDMKRIIYWFHKTYDQQDKWLLGQSLGASLALHVSGSEKELAQGFNGIIADSGFANFRKIGQDVFSRYWFTWTLQLPMSWFMPKGFDADKVIANISPTPLLLLHSTDDWIVPYYHSKRLLNKAKEPVELLSYQGFHIHGFKQIEVQNQVLNFLNGTQTMGHTLK